MSITVFQEFEQIGTFKHICFSTIATVATIFDGTHFYFAILQFVNEKSSTFADCLRMN